MAEHDSEREPEEKEAPPGGDRGDFGGSSPGDSSGTSGAGGTPSAGLPSAVPPGDTPSGTPAGTPPPGAEPGVPFDEDAAWRAIVAGYGDEPPDPPGAKPFKSVEDLALLETDPNDSAEESAGEPGGGRPGRSAEKKPSGTSSDEPSEQSARSEDAEKGGDSAEQGGPAATLPLGGSVAFAPGVGGPRDYRLAEPEPDRSGKGGAEDDDEDGEGHFVPPEPPPLPAADTTAKFAWLGVVGGPLLLLLAVLLGWHMTWWLATLGIGGFLGGFATLVLRMQDDDEENDDPGRGAVV
ncbi:hypothetical protein [Streptomyces sp. CRN 30]|uniref:hypothetical protein n=1 Tax=Streptomyces sp. CRN 30 TaxID=3075613 RepID=UPI002A803057|nr:hypothetical protein [Streptomyces sp. CRN 30]